MQTSNAEMVTISRAEYEEFQAQRKKISELESRVDVLMEALRLARHKQFGASSEKSEDSLMEQLSFLFNEAEVFSAAEKETTENTTVVAAHTRHKKHEYTLDSIPEDIPKERVEHRLEGEDLVCPQCGDTLTEIGTEVVNKLKIIPAQTIVELCATRLPKNMGIPADQIQVLSPTRKGGVGTVALNRMLQASLNPPSPGKREKAFGEYLFREGDRVMQIRNNYDIVWKKCDGSAMGTGMFNGDVGVIKSLDLATETLTIVFDDREATYDFTQLDELEPAYAMTVHKSQGSEYRAVVLTAWNGHPNLMIRSVLYTAITRARELLIIVGRQETVAAMTENAKRSRRYTGLKLRLQGKCE